MEIYTIIGLEQPAAAERYLDRMEAQTNLLRSQPRMGARRTDISASARILIETPYLILYRTEPDTDQGAISTIEIIRVVDGRRNLSGILG